MDHSALSARPLHIRLVISDAVRIVACPSLEIEVVGELACAVRCVATARGRTRRAGKGGAWAGSVIPRIDVAEFGMARAATARVHVVGSVAHDFRPAPRGPFDVSGRGTSASPTGSRRLVRRTRPQKKIALPCWIAAPARPKSCHRRGSFHFVDYGCSMSPAAGSRRAPWASDLPHRCLLGDSACPRPGAKHTWCRWSRLWPREQSSQPLQRERSIISKGRFGC